MHGDLPGLAAAADGAAEQGLHLLLLGDLLDGGADPSGCARLVLELRKERRASFLVGNHERKLLMALRDRSVRRTHGLAETLAAIEGATDATTLREALVEAIATAPAWLRCLDHLFVHAAFHPAMLVQAPRTGVDCMRPDPVLSRALFGEVESLPEPGRPPRRGQRWVDTIPGGLTVVVGHDMVSQDGRPVRRQGAQGGIAWFLDTGAGKGGHLSWLDLRFEPSGSRLLHASRE